ncbi:MAG: plastocyanin/azurin family copper-binding protein [Aureliella sp.]
MIRTGLITSFVLCLCLPVPLHAQEAAGHAHHGSGGQADRTVKPPKLFLDKSPKIVEYQLKRLSNAELLAAERSTDSPKYIPVYAAILTRAGLPSGERRAAAEALAKLRSTSVVQELLTGLGTLTTDDDATARLARDLASALLAEPKSALLEHRDELQQSLAAKSAWARRAAVAGLLVAGRTDDVRKHAGESPEHAIDFLAAVHWLGDQKQRDALRGDILALLANDQPVEVRRRAIAALATLSSDGTDDFARLAGLYAEQPLRAEAVKAMLQVPVSASDEKLLPTLTEKLVEGAEATPIAERTSESFIDAVQLAEKLMAGLPADTSRAYRERLRKVAVRVVRVRTVEEEMRYDVKYFAVEAGRPVEVILINQDVMPHNFVVTAPGALKEVAFEAAKMAPDQAPGGKQYVPASDKVLFATSMVPSGKQERLSFSAPQTPGEYPFVCTFPNHWMRMYGVMVVVDDLDAWQKKPTVPADPIGNNRSFVRKWTTADLEGQLVTGLRGRSPEIGQRLIQEATCLQCHKLNGQGGVVGPDLGGLAERWKGDTRGILQEILDPSHKIDPKYAVQSVLTADGKVYSGIIVAEDKDSLSIVSSPEQTQPLTIPRDDVDEIVKSSKSIMPIGLLDQYTQDEIFEILAYLTTQPAAR